MVFAHPSYLLKVQSQEKVVAIQVNLREFIFRSRLIHHLRGLGMF